MSNTVGFNGIILRLLDNDHSKPEVAEIFTPLNDHRAIRLWATMLLFIVIISAVLITATIISIASYKLTIGSSNRFIGIILLIIIIFATLIVFTIANMAYSIMSFYLVEFEAGPWEAIKNSFAIFKSSWRHWINALGVVIAGSLLINIILWGLTFIVTFVVSSVVILLGTSSGIAEGSSLILGSLIQFIFSTIQYALVAIYAAIIYGMAYRAIMKPENIIEDNN